MASKLDYTSLVEMFETYLTQHQPGGMPDSLYEPIRYINEMKSKRIRPLLLLMAYNLWHEDVSPALPAALAIEYFHNFSLMHDDIMDESALRRGQEAVHIRYDRNTAILSGDALLIKCYEWLLIAGAPVGKGATLCSMMTEIALTICEGQQMDMDFEKMESTDQALYLEMIRRKTACLLGVSLKMGAILAGASEEDANNLYRFGEKAGIAFQIQDDVLDTFGKTKMTGKKQGGDIMRGKKNFLFVRAWSVLNIDEKERFSRDYFSSNEENIKAVLGLYRNLEVESFARDMEDRYFKEALFFLEKLMNKDLACIHSLIFDLSKRAN